MTHCDAIVVGGGVAGLTAAFELTRRGLRPVVLESTGTVGGTVARHRLGGLELDAGADSFAVARPSVTHLLTDLGLAGRIERPTAAAAWVRHEAGTAPLPAGSLLGIPGTPTAADVHRALGRAGVDRALVDAALPAEVGLTPDVTLGSLVRARMGRTVLRRLVEPVAGGVHAADPDTLELTTVAPLLAEALIRTGSLAAAVRDLRGGGAAPGSAVAGLRGGMFELISALTAAITGAGGEVRTGVTGRPEAVEGGFLVGDLWAGRLVLATGPAAAAALLPRLLPTAPLEATAGVGADVLLATLVIDAGWLDSAPRGTGVLVSAHATGVRAKALTHATAKWRSLAEAAGPGRHVLRLSYGRPGELLPDPAELPAIALADAGTLLGGTFVPAELVDAEIISWPSALPPGRPGQAAAVAALRAALDTKPGLGVVGAWMAGTGLAAVVADARTVAAGLR